MTTPSLLNRARLGALSLGLAAVAAAAAISGCGASATIDPVAQAADRSAGATGYRMDFTMQLSTGAVPGQIGVTGQGSFDPPGHSGSFAMKMALPNSPALRQVLGSSGLTLHEVLKGNVIYVQLPSALTSRIPGASGKSWIKVDLSKLPNGAGSGLSALTSGSMSSDPSQLLQYLRGAGGMSKVGSEQVAGFATTHYRGHVDVDQAVSRVPKASQAAVKRAIATFEAEGFGKQLPVDVWVDKQGLVRAMELHLSGAPNGQTVSATIRVTIPQYGPQPAASAPPASQIISLPSGAAI